MTKAKANMIQKGPPLPLDSAMIDENYKTNYACNLNNAIQAEQSADKSAASEKRRA